MPEPLLVCPHDQLRLDVGTTVTCSAGHTFPRRNGFIDFVNRPAVDAGLAETFDHAEEASGLDRRVNEFLLPRLQAKFGGTANLRLLDDGAGGGEVVRLLAAKGLDAYGIDPGSRSTVWPDMPDRLFMASGLELPFADETFDVVFSSGVLEHVGDPLKPGPERAVRVDAYLGELIRVLKVDGVGYVGFPNGLHPIDYWHPLKGSVRWHSPWQEWMPRPRDVRRGVSSAQHPASVRFVSPEGFLGFERIRKFRYGRALERPMRTIMRSIDKVPALAASPLNPWLIAEVVRVDGGGRPVQLLG